MRHLSDIDSLSDEALRTVLAMALEYDGLLEKRQGIGAPLANYLQFNLFYENSTRTSLSFVVAAERMGAHVVNVPVAASSVHKGESLRDTVLTLGAQGADFLVLRATEAGAIDAAKTALGEGGFATAVINGGEGAFGHPTQALLDAATLLKAFRRSADDGLGGLTISIIGDLLHSRVAASATRIFTRLGAAVRLCAPDGLEPAWDTSGVETIVNDRGSALEDCDVAMALRIQKERFGERSRLDPERYRTDFGLSMEALSFAKPTTFVMHPGPMNRGVEIDSDVADDTSRSLVTKQVAMGVPTRMAVLHFAAEL